MKKRKISTKINLHDFAYVFAATIAVFVLFCVAGLAPFLRIDKAKNFRNTGEKNSISRLSPHAFGDISVDLQNSSQENSGNEADAAVGLGGGGGVASLVGKVAADSSIAIIRENSFKYLYSGEEFSQESNFLPVYKRIISSVSGNFSSVISAVQSLNFSIANLSKFMNLEVDTLSLKEDRAFGYFIGISPVANNFYINKNWEKWPNPSSDCSTDDCWKRNRVKISDVPSDDEIKRIANNFVKEYSISIDGFGEPVIQDSWRIAYESSQNKENYYIPEEIFVIYPMTVEGLEVYDQNGNAYGLSVGVDIKNRKVGNVNRPINIAFQSSDYEVLIDYSEIIKKAESGGSNGRWYFMLQEDSENSQTIELGTPKIVLMKQWKYERESGKNYEILLPSYLFPVVSRSDGDNYFYAKNVIVPLVKEFYEDNSVIPMPLIKETIAGEEVITEEDQGMPELK